METKESKGFAIIITLLTVLICGCPGLSLALFGVITILGLSLRRGDFKIVSSTGPLPAWYGDVFIAVALFMITVPVLVGFFTLREKKPAENTNQNDGPQHPTPK